MGLSVDQLFRVLCRTSVCYKTFSGQVRKLPVVELERYLAVLRLTVMMSYKLPLTHLCGCRGFQFLPATIGDRYRFSSVRKSPKDLSRFPDDVKQRFDEYCNQESKQKGLHVKKSIKRDEKFFAKERLVPVENKVNTCFHFTGAKIRTESISSIFLNVPE